MGGRPLGGERGKFQAGSRIHRTDGNAIFAEDRGETTRTVSTRRRLNVAPTAARKISGFAVFVPPTAERLRVEEISLCHVVSNAVFVQFESISDIIIIIILLLLNKDVLNIHILQ